MKDLTESKNSQLLRSAFRSDRSKKIHDETTGLFLFALCATGIPSVKPAENGEYDKERKRKRKRNREELEQLRHVAEY